MHERKKNNGPKLGPFYERFVAISATLKQHLPLCKNTDLLVKHLVSIPASLHYHSSSISY